MNLMSPWNLLWLLPLGGGILALWMLRLKRQEVTISSLFLWQSLLKETQANTPFQKLRRNLLLFLQLLTAFLLIFALARPFVYGRGATGRTIVVLLDKSAPMNATDVSPSRLAAAKSAADHFLDTEMNGSDVATVITVTNKPADAVGFTTSKKRLEAAIDDAPPTDTVADMPAALTLAQSLVGARPGAIVRVFSDGAFSPDDDKKLAGINLSGADIQQVPVGKPDADNVAITEMDGRRSPSTGQYQIFVEAQNLGTSTHSGATLSLYNNGRLIDARALTLTGGSQSETFDSPLLQQGGLVTAKLDDLKDDLVSDNQASLVLPPPRKRRILLVSSGNLFLEQGLNLDPDVVLEECSTDEFATVGKNGAGYALVVFDGALPSTPLPPGDYLTFGITGGSSALAGTTGTADSPQFIDQSRTNPIMRFVDLEGLRLSHAPEAATASWAQTLAEADSGTLIAAGQHDGIQMISVAFDLSDSDWPIRVSFPVFLTNAANWLTAGGGLGASATDTPAGAVAAITVPPGLSSVTVARPDGHSLALTAPPAGGMVLYDQTDRVGVYHVRAGSADYPFAVNLLNKQASTLTPQRQAALNHPATLTAAVPSATIRRVKNDLWLYVAAGGLVFLILEWLVFHRRL